MFGIKYQQGKQNLCFQRGLQSAIYHCKSLHENIYQNKDSIECVEVASQYDQVHNDIEKSMKVTFNKVINHSTFLLGKKHIKFVGVPDTISKIMRHNRWNCVRIDKKIHHKKDSFNSTWERFFRKNTNKFITVQLQDSIGNDSHWVTIYREKIFNSNWNRTCLLTSKNLNNCCTGGNFVGFGKMYMYFSKLDEEK